MKKVPVATWLRNKEFSVRGVSVIWKGFIHSLSWLGSGLIWKVGNGKAIWVGLDPIVGLGSPFTLPLDLWDYLEDYGISTLDQARNYSTGAQKYWFTAEELDLGGDWKLLWDNFTSGLEYGRIRLSEQNNSLLWSHDKYFGVLTVAHGYECIVSTNCTTDLSPVLDLLWKLNIPTKIRCFIWLLVRNRVLTWDKL